jgi:hypothetical protein
MGNKVYTYATIPDKAFLLNNFDMTNSLLQVCSDARFCYSCSFQSFYSRGTGSSR